MLRTVSFAARRVSIDVTDTALITYVDLCWRHSACVVRQLHLFFGPQASALRACRPFASASPAVNWEDIEKVVKTEQGKRELLSLRSAFSEVSSKLQTLSEVSGRASGPGDADLATMGLMRRLALVRECGYN